MNKPQATHKHPQLDTFLSALTGKDRIKMITLGLCTTCEGDALKVSFKDALSFKEYEISGMCQKCQDKVFGV